MAKSSGNNHKLSEKDIQTLVDLGIVGSAEELNNLSGSEVMKRYDEYFAELKGLGPGKEAAFRLAYNRGVTDIKN